MLRVILAFLATVMTAVQSLMIYTEGKAICFNSGCEIVESLTAVPSLYVNVAGFIFFLLLFWCFYFGRNGSEFWVEFAGLVLLAGLVAEAVLVFFQFTIAKVFCTYCLAVLAFVVLLNVLSGVRQLFRGAVLFGAVLLACFSLQFGLGITTQKSLADGAIATLAAENEGPEIHLFFSKTCVHCEKVITALKEGSSCSVAFNPIEKIDQFTFPKASLNASYDPAANLGFLRSLSLTGIPVLVAKDGGQIRVMDGSGTILDYLETNCLVKQSRDDTGYSGSSSVDSNDYARFMTTQSEADNCSVEEDCTQDLQTLPGTMSKE